MTHLYIFYIKRKFIGLYHQNICHLLNEDRVGALADLDLAVTLRRLSNLVERHHHYSATKPLNIYGIFILHKM